MLKVRLIPVLLLQAGHLVRSERFVKHQIIGNPLEEIRRFNEWNVDEIVYLDISEKQSGPAAVRPDHRDRVAGSLADILATVSANCFMPLTVGGGIRSIEDIRFRLANGADKVTLNTALLGDPELLTQGARRFGSQAMVACVDARRLDDDRYEAVVDHGRVSTGSDPVAWARRAESLGAGEILLQSVDRDGTGRGYDLELIGSVASAVDIPVIALGGVGTYEQYARAVKAGASAVAAANIFHFKELSDRNAKRAMAAAGVPVRLN